MKIIFFTYSSVAPIKIAGNFFITIITAGNVRETMNATPKIAKPIFFFFASGYKIIGDIKNSCISTARYHR